MIYREKERVKAIGLIRNTNLFNGAKSGRIIRWKGKEYPKDEIFLDGINNIYEPIRNDVIKYFLHNSIKFWHARNASETNDKPSGHVLSSQVCCINHLFPIRHDEKAVLSVAKMLCPGIKEVFLIPTDKYSPGYIQFESVTDKDHLNEIKTIRGSYCTSVDALIYGKHDNGKKYIIPIEWKYTEYYNNEDKSVEDRGGEAKGMGSRGKERLRRYSDLIKNSQYLKDLPDYRNSAYFFEPFYQLMRQTLWAEQMIKHNETETIKADDYMHIHIIPSENTKLLDKIYKPSNEKMKETWINCLKNKEKYKIINPKDLLKTMDKEKYNDLIQYLNKRYWE
jgi:hypothetical protein